MPDKLKVTIFYDALEDEQKAKAEAEHKPFPLAYAQVAEALEKRGHSVKAVALTKKIPLLVNVIEKDNSDVIFNLCEQIASSSQHEHNVVGLLELYEKCFTGCGSAGWLLGQDKALCKKILQFHGIRYPRFCTVARGRVEWSDELDFPLIVKPLNEDASLGIDSGSVVHSVKELMQRISHVHEEFGEALVEEFIPGREIYVGVLGNEHPEALPILEWDFSKVTEGPKIAGKEAKWDHESDAYRAPEIFPDDIPAEVVKNIQAAAVTAYQALKLRGYARVDMRLSETPAGKGGDKPGSGGKQTSAWDFPIIEVNPNCWLEKRSEFAMAARKRGLTYPELLQRIVDLALERRAARAA